MRYAGFLTRAVGTDLLTACQYKPLTPNIMTYIIINTADYNCDGHYAVTEATENELADYGLDKVEIDLCKRLSVGQMIPSEYEMGAYFMRVI